MRLVTRVMSFVAGRVACTPLPISWRGPLFRLYATLSGADLSECGAPLNSYRSLQIFFGRSLREGCRTLDTGVLSPADGRLSESGTIEQGTLLQAKGRRYTLAEFLSDGSLAAEFEGGEYFTVYLSPGDYHRVHSPVQGRITEVRRISGALLPVSPWSVSLFDRVFSRNERLVIRIELSEGRSCLLVMIGALHVGSMALTFTSMLTNSSFSEIISPIGMELQGFSTEIEKGAQVGEFRFGSSVVLIFPKGSLSNPVRQRGRVRYGQNLAELSQ